VNREVARPPVAGKEKPSVNWGGESDVSGEKVFVGGGGGGGKSFKSSPNSAAVNSFVVLSSNVFSGSSGWASWSSSLTTNLPFSSKLPFFVADPQISFSGGELPV